MSKMVAVENPSIKTLYTMRYNQSILLRIHTIKINKLKRFISQNSQIQISMWIQCTMSNNLNTFLRIPMTKITLNMIQTSKITEESSKIMEESSKIMEESSKIMEENSSNITEAAGSLITEVVEPLQWQLCLDKLQFKIQLQCRLPGHSNIKVECIIHRLPQDLLPQDLNTIKDKGKSWYMFTQMMDAVALYFDFQLRATF